MVTKEKKERKAPPPREPDAIVSIDKNFRVKVTQYGLVLQEKGGETDLEDNESKKATDDGWGNNKYLNDDWAYVGIKIFRTLIRKAVSKEKNVTLERLVEIVTNTSKKVENMFASIDKETNTAKLIKENKELKEQINKINQKIDTLEKVMEKNFDKLQKKK